ncbi:MAG TPA: hypothetical protein VK797_16830 [Tepidisphaeraceae bacterium]|jgi:hypothetical protein|nr:hypothetical protein [Tepidisphaeraceae bacterium]
MEEILPPQTQSGAGFELTRIRQFTVFLENRVGRLQGLLRAFEESAGKICGLSIEESADSALVRIICSEPDLGREALRGGGFSFSESELLAVEMPKRTRQPLMAVCAALLAAEINIHYAYPLLQRPHGPAMALYVEDPTLAAQLLIRKGFTLLGESDLRK